MNIAIDLGKRRSYVVMEDNDKIVREGYVPSNREDFLKFFGNVKGCNVVVEACTNPNRIAMMFDGFDIIVAHPAKVRLIAESMKKTDKIDAHILLELYKRNYLPTSYLPNADVRRARDICRNRAFLVRQRVAVKNKLRYEMYGLGIEFKYWGKKNIAKLDDHISLVPLVYQLRSLNAAIDACDLMIEKEWLKNEYAKLIDTIPGIGTYGALVIASEIGDVNRFADENRLSSYAGLVPRIYQSGDTERRGHIVNGDTFLRTILIECVQMHISICSDSNVTYAYERISLGAGPKKAKIAAARRLLRVIYFMLKRNEVYNSNERG